VNPRSSPSSSKRTASSDPSRKQGREEVPPPPPAEPEEVPPLPPEEVPPPPPEEVKRLKPPRRKVPPPMGAPSVNVEDACFSVKILYQACQSLKKMAVHFGVQRPPEPLQMTVMDYAFKVNVVTPDFRRGTKCISYVRQDQFTHI
jgi:hypothetical protein